MSTYTPRMNPKRAVLIVAIGLLVGLTAQAADRVWLLDIDDEIGRGTASTMRGGIAAAEEGGAELVIVRLATPGGLLDSALVVRDLLLETNIPTVAFVDREALSAGALIALACEEIAFAPGGVIGAATAVIFDATGSFEEAPEKVQSTVRTLFRATAEARGRDPQIAEAMVDPEAIVPDLAEAGRLLTLTAQEAELVGYSDASANTLGELVSAKGFESSEVVRYEIRTVDLAAETITSTALAAVLLVVGLLGLIIEMVIPGFGIAGVVGILCLGAFFWAHFLVGLAGWESIAFVAGGLLAIILEIFVFTAADFGLAGIGGLVLVGLGFYTSMVGPLTNRASALQAIGIVSIGVVAALVIAVVLITRLPKSKLRFGGVILSSTIAGSAFSRRQSEREPTEWVGRTGIAGTDLRPVGIGVFDEERADVVCEEGHLDKGTPLIVVKDEGYRKVVRKLSKEA